MIRLSVYKHPEKYCPNGGNQAVVLELSSEVLEMLGNPEIVYMTHSDKGCSISSEPRPGSIHHKVQASGKIGPDTSRLGKDAMPHLGVHEVKPSSWKLDFLFQDKPQPRKQAPQKQQRQRQRQRQSENAWGYIVRNGGTR